ncbi:MAG TPA: metal-sulfur cluster assembly factor [Candidatus Nanopusillus sp.]|nr:metal-sulfur cluster assembly factor [Candidatus Nanopusillus sp.]
MDEKQRILNALREIRDPELGYDIVSLGMIEEIKIENGKVHMRLLPTTPMCPYLPYLIEAIAVKIKKLGYDVEVEIDLENQWSPERIDPEVRKKLGI